MFAGAFALLSLLAGFTGLALFLRSAGSLAGLVLIGAGIPLAIAGWWALGRPVTRRDVAS